MPTTSVKHMRAKWQLTPTQLGKHLGLSGNVVKMYEAGNLTIPIPVMRLMALLDSQWIEHGYKGPMEMWGPLSTDQE